MRGGSGTAFLFPNPPIKGRFKSENLYLFCTHTRRGFTGIQISTRWSAELETPKIINFAINRRLLSVCANLSIYIFNRFEIN